MMGAGAGKISTTEHILHFRANPGGPDPVAVLDDGTRVFPDRDHKGKVRAGETWVCSVERAADVSFATPLRRHRPTLEALMSDADAVAALLDAPGGEKLRRSLERVVRMEVRETFGTELDAITRRLDGIAQRVPSEAPRDDDGEEPTEAWGAVRPTLDHDEVPDDEFMVRKIVYQLYARGCWGGKHTSGEHFRKGYLKGVDKGVIEDVVGRLVRDEMLMPHGKRPDEHYSLNPRRAAFVFQLLGIERPWSAKNGETEPVEASKPELTETESSPRQELENALRPIRTQLASLSHSMAAAHTPTALAGELERVRDDVRALAARASGSDSRMTRVEGQVERAARALPAAEPVSDERLRALINAVLDDMAKSLPPSDIGAPMLRELQVALGLSDGTSLRAAREFVQAMSALGLTVRDLGPVRGVGDFGSCAVDGCENEPMGFSPAIDLHDLDDPSVLAALACVEHLKKPRIVVKLPETLDRRTALVAVERLIGMGPTLRLHKPTRFTSRHVQLVGAREAKAAWDLAARRVR